MMRPLGRFLFAASLCLLLSSPVLAQEDQDGESPVPAKSEPASPTAKSPGKLAAPAAPAPNAPVEAELPPPAAVGAMDDEPVAQLQALDKITARVSKLEIRVGQTASFGSLGIAVKACRMAPPENTPEAAVFLQIWEQKPGESEPKWVYRGWMFASSPALAAMDHPVYDIWLVACKKDSTSAASPPPAPVPATPPATSAPPK